MNPAMTGEVDLKQLIEYTLRGGWPAGVNMSVEQTMYLSAEYLDAVLEDDIYRLDA